MASDGTVVMAQTLQAGLLALSTTTREQAQITLQSAMPKGQLHAGCTYDTLHPNLATTEPQCQPLASILWGPACLRLNRSFYMDLYLILQSKRSLLS